MGRHTTAAPVPFKLDANEVAEVIQDLIQKLYDDESEEEEVSFRDGWVLLDGRGVGGIYYELTLKKLETGELVDVLNEHQYANGGGEDWSAVAATKELLEEFAKLLSIMSPDIEGPAAVQKTC